MRKRPPCGIANCRCCRQNGGQCDQAKREWRIEWAPASATSVPTARKTAAISRLPNAAMRRASSSFRSGGACRSRSRASATALRSPVSMRWRPISTRAWWCPITTRDAAGKEMNSLNFADAVDQNVRGAAQFLKRNGAKAGITGFCLGGVVSIIAAAKIPELVLRGAVLRHSARERVQARRREDPAAGALRAEGHLDPPPKWSTGSKPV